MSRPIRGVLLLLPLPVELSERVGGELEADEALIQRLVRTPDPPPQIREPLSHTKLNHTPESALSPTHPTINI